MATQIPAFQLTSFPRHEPATLFCMARLERLVEEVKGIDKTHSHGFYLVMWISHGSGTHTIDFKTYTVPQPVILSHAGASTLLGPVGRYDRIQSLF